MLAALAVTGAQLATSAGTLVTVLQVVVVQPLPDVATAATQLGPGTSVVLLVLQVVVV